MTLAAASIPLHSDCFDAPNSDSLSDIHIPDARKPPEAPPKTEWSRRIAITTEPLWLAKVRQHKFKTFLVFFLPSVMIFLLAFFLAPPTAHSTSNDLKFYLGGMWKPDMPVTAGVVPKRFHSHDDYKQYAPLLAALSYGASSIEVAVWEMDGQLLVGDDPSELSSNKTLKSVYLDPILWLIQDANSIKIGNSTYGVFATAPYLPLQLVVTIYSDGASAFDLLLNDLELCQEAGYLTTFNTSDPSSGLNFGALTVIAGGNAPVSSVLAGDEGDPIRYVFYDAPLATLDSDGYNYTRNLSPLASAPWGSTIGARWLVPSLAKKKIRQYVNKAHALGIQARFWGTPTIPRWARNKIWQMLLDEGADWLDVDDLCDASNF